MLPPRHESLAYGEYANVVRGKRAKQGPLPPLSEETPLRLRLKAAWRELLRHIYEVDPLLCPRGGPGQLGQQPSSSGLEKGYLRPLRLGVCPGYATNASRGALVGRRGRNQNPYP